MRFRTSGVLAVPLVMLVPLPSATQAGFAASPTQLSAPAASVGAAHDMAPVIKRFRLRRSRIGHTHRFSDAFVLTLSKPATVNVEIQAEARGIKRGKHCAAAPKHLGAHAKRCTLYGTPITVLNKTPARSVVIGIRSRLVSDLSGLGPVRATAIATDAFGQASAPRRLTLRLHDSG